MPDVDPQLMAAALEVFREYGYGSTTLELVAQRSKTPLDQVRQQYADKDKLLAALLSTYSPLASLLHALDSVEGDSAEEIVRDAMRRTVKAIQQHEQFIELAAIDLQVNNGNFLAGISMQILPKALEMLERLKSTGQLRPVSDLCHRSLVWQCACFRSVPGSTAQPIFYCTASSKTMLARTSPWSA